MSLSAPCQIIFLIHLNQFYWSGFLPHYHHIWSSKCPLKLKSSAQKHILHVSIKCTTFLKFVVDVMLQVIYLAEFTWSDSLNYLKVETVGASIPKSSFSSISGTRWVKVVPDAALCACCRDSAGLSNTLAFIKLMNWNSLLAEMKLFPWETPVRFDVSRNSLIHTHSFSAGVVHPCVVWGPGQIKWDGGFLYGSEPRFTRGCQRGANQSDLQLRSGL